MKEKVLWLFFYGYHSARKYINWVINRLKIKFHIPSLIKKGCLLSVEDTHRAIAEHIQDGVPALIARFGSNEALCTVEGIGIELGLRRKFSKKVLHLMHFNAGMFPQSQEMARRFAQISCEAAKNVDILGFWNSFMQDYLALNVCSPKTKLTSLTKLEPYSNHGGRPWTAALKGKKVLVIHPFKDTIESQYTKRHLLFSDPDILPDFELIVLRAIQTIAEEKDSRFSDWEEALNYMCEEALKYDFDVAIIGCGAYGMPLASKLKDNGKVAIHLGGATQLLFGIKGARWDSQEQGKLYNKYWVRPSQNETPKAAKQIEDACYW